VQQYSAMQQKCKCTLCNHKSASKKMSIFFDGWLQVFKFSNSNSSNLIRIFAVQIC
jgi:hypothetical protein